MQNGQGSSRRLGWLDVGWKAGMFRAWMSGTSRPELKDLEEKKSAILSNVGPVKDVQHGRVVGVSQRDTPRSS